MNNIEKEGVIALLTKKGVYKPCPRCDSDEFQVVDIERIITKVSIFSALSFSFIEVLCIACSNCFYLTFHAKNPLIEKPE
jgi:predicted nucleic-acid-binding Zn-ribbon protein